MVKKRKKKENPMISILVLLCDQRKYIWSFFFLHGNNNIACIKYKNRTVTCKNHVVRLRHVGSSLSSHWDL